MRASRATQLLRSLSAVAALIACVFFGFGAAEIATASTARTATTAANPSGDAATAVIRVGQVDATRKPVTLQGWLTGAPISDLRISTHGAAAVPAAAKLSSDLGQRTDVVVVLDNSALLGNAVVQLSKKAVAPLMPGAGVADSLSIISTGGSSKVEIANSTSAAQVQEALNRVRPLGESATWDGLVAAADLLENRGKNGNGTVVLFAASSSTAINGGSSAALAALRKAGVDLQVIAAETNPNLEGLSLMVADLGGSLQVLNSDTQILSQFDQTAKIIAGRFELELATSEDTAALVPVTLTAASASTNIAYVPGLLRVGLASLSAVPESDEGLFGFLQTPLMRWLIILLGVAAVVTIAWTGLSMLIPDENSLNRRLRHYEEVPDASTTAGLTGVEGHATVPIIQRAVAVTGSIADRRGLTEKLELDLERANLPLRAAEVMFFVAAAAGTIAVFTFMLTRSLIPAVIAGVLVIVLPRALLNLRIRRRQKAFGDQLPDTLTLLAGTIRAGYAVSQGFESVSTEISEPMGRELRRVVTETRLGRTLEESLEAVAERMESADFAWAVMAIRIQREVGGNLAELLTTVADTMTQRERLRREVSTLTAEGRMSAMIIGLLPPGLAVVMWVMNPAYISELFQPGLGYMLLGVAVLMMGIGFAWMKKTITIEV
ncbi:MAG: type II secretion system F family protein [Microthrixaceae bacterium]